MCHVLGYKFGTQQNNDLCPCKADILATHSSHLSQCMVPNHIWGDPWGPHLWSLLPYFHLGSIALFSFAQDPSWQGSCQLFICLFFLLNGTEY